MRPSAGILAVVLLGALAASAAEPRVFVMGVWPNRLRLFDERSESFTGEIQLRDGAVTNYGSIPHTPDYDKLFFVTGRMETVEIVDPVKMESVDSFRLSTPGRRVRISGLHPGPDGKLVYLQAGAVQLGSDRFTREDVELILYDVEAREVRETVELPPEVQLGFLPTLHVSADQKSLYVIGSSIWQLSTETHEIVDTIEWGKSAASGYGGIQAMGLTQHEPDVFWGTYRTEDPLMKKDLWGVVRLDLNVREFDAFELGPALDVSYFALSPDGLRGYAGLGDFAVIDMTERRIVSRKEGFERGRTNMAIIVSADASKLYVTGVGNAIDVYDAESLIKERSIFVGADITSPALPLPSSLFERP